MPITSFVVRGPDGRAVHVPEAYDGESDALTAASPPATLREALARDGYVVVRGLVPVDACHAAVRAFEAEIKPDRGFFHRHTGTSERHVFTDHGHMKFPIMNFHDLPQSRHGTFVGRGMGVLTHQNVQGLIKGLFGEPGKIIHTMFFDGNQVTKPHQDAYYVDSDQVGSGVGIWVALEDIGPGAGRFFVCPGSHKLDIPKTARWPDDAGHKALVLGAIADLNLPIHAPAMRRGDAILWSTKTIHGSLDTATPERSRRCFTAHYIPASHGYLLFQSRLKAPHVGHFNGVEVRHSMDQNQWRNRVKFLWSSHHPRSFAWAMRARR